MRWKKRKILYAAAAVAIFTVPVTGAVDQPESISSSEESKKQFSLILDSHSTRCLSVGASAFTVEKYLEELPNIDGVSVVRSGDEDSNYSYSITFDGDNLSSGNQDEIRIDQSSCNNFSSSPFLTKVETVQDGDANDGGNLLEKDILNLFAGFQYHFKVSAWNGVGQSYGPSQYSTPAIVSPADLPAPPQNVEILPAGPSALTFRWVEPLDDGGLPITKYRVEWSTESHFPNNMHSTQSDVVGFENEVQSLIVRSTAQDLSGFVVIYFMGQQSEKIQVDSTAQELKNILEGMSAIDAVQVVSHDREKLSFFEREWIITFTSQTGKLPSMLVFTGSGTPSIVASGGTLGGSSPKVIVKEKRKGILPNTYTTNSNLKSGRKYFARVQAYNGKGWGNHAVFSYGLAPKKKLPSELEDVFVSIISDTQLLVSWVYNDISDANDVTKYSVQWDTDHKFDLGYSIVDHSRGVNEYSYLIENLEPFTTYLVRVLAYNSEGYGEISNAVPTNKGEKIDTITFMNNGEMIFSEKFALRYVFEGISITTDQISVLSLPERVEEALNKFSSIGTVSVSREDHSSYFDNTVKSTLGFNMTFRITFNPTYGDEEFGNITVVEASENLIYVESSKTNRAFIETLVNHPSKPKTVELWAVSNTELGVKWKEPIHNGGAEIQKYLVEWDKLRTFKRSAVAIHNLYSNTEDGPTNWSEVVSTLSYQIVGLDPYEEYFVRVSAFNEAGYSSAKSSSPASVSTSDVPLYLPNTVLANISQSEVPDRIYVEWSFPRSDMNGFVTDLDECGVTTGHTPNIPSWYEFKWENAPGNNKQTSYRVSMVNGNGQILPCCYTEKCSIEIGAEVQTITINSNENKHLSKAKFKVMYLGKQSPQVVIRVTSGSAFAAISGYPTESRMSTGDFIKINHSVYQVVDINNSTVELSSSYVGDQIDAEIIAYYNTPPQSCFNPLKDSAQDMKTHIETRLDNSPFGEDVSVSMSSFENNQIQEVQSIEFIMN